MGTAYDGTAGVDVGFGCRASLFCGLRAPLRLRRLCGENLSPFFGFASASSEPSDEATARTEDSAKTVKRYFIVFSFSLS